VTSKDIQVILVTINLHRGVDKQKQTKDAEYSTVLFFVESHQREKQSSNSTLVAKVEVTTVQEHKRCCFVPLPLYSPKSKSSTSYYYSIIITISQIIMITSIPIPIPTSLSTHPLLLPHSSPFPTVEEQNNQKRKREEEGEMGCESPLQINKSIQFHPTTPEKSSPYPPNPSLVQRMLTDTCFKCKQQGHWSMYCPKNNTNHSPVLSSNKQIHCRCGHGFCDVKISNSERNKGRLYFACPIKRVCY